MGEDQQLKTYYRPRIQIPLDTVFDQTGQFAWYCLPKDGVSILRKLLDYGKRQITYIETIINERQFIAPDSATMADIRELVERTDLGLMSECGTDELNTTLEAINITLQAMRDCICETTDWQRQQASDPGDVSGYVDVGNVTYENTDDAQASPSTPATDAAKCEIAQAHFWYVFNAFTEDILPVASSTANTITAAIVATATFAGLATFIGIPVAVLTSMLAAVVAWGVDGSIVEFTNWLFASKDEIICEIYNALPDYNLAAALVADYIDAEESISFLDKSVLKTMMASAWHMRFAAEEQQTNGTWDEFIESGACDECVEIPEDCIGLGSCVPTDWVGGTVDCTGGWATIKSGQSYHVPSTLPIPSETCYLVVRWLPVTDLGYPTASMLYGLRDFVGDSIYMVGNTGPEAEGVPVDSWFNVPSALWGKDVQLVGQQDVYWGAPIYWCITTTYPG